MKAEVTNATTLEQLLQGGAPIPAADALSILRGCGARLDSLSQHRRLNPARIQLDSHADVHIEGDEAVPDSDNADALPAPQHAAYLSPEEILGTPTDRQSSEFSLAVIAYEMLTGRKPFTDNNLSALIYEICAAAPMRADSVNPGLNAATADVLARALAKDPGERFPSCGEFVDALESALQQPASPQPPVVQPAAEPVRERPVVQPGVQPAEKAETPSFPELPAARRRRSFDALETGAGIASAHAVEQPRIGSRNLVRMAVICVLAAFLLVFLIDRHPSPAIPQQTIDPRVGPVGPPPPPEDNSEDENGSTAAPGTTAPTPKSQHEPQRGAPAVARNRPAVPSTTARATSVRAPMARLSLPKGSALNSNAQPQVGNGSSAGAGSADIELLTEPPGALVTVDGRSGKSCTAPCTLLLPAGRHVLTAQLQGYSVAQRIFNTPETSSLIIALGANSGTIIITSNPAGATIAVDGRPAGRCPITLRLSAGQHRLEASAGGQIQEQTVNMQADSIQGATFDLR